MGLYSKLMHAFARPSVVCPKCWRANPANVAFCGDCGGSMKGAAAVEDDKTMMSLTAEVNFKEVERAAAGVAEGSFATCAFCNERLSTAERYCHSCGKLAPGSRGGGKTAAIGGFDLDVGKKRPRLSVLNADGSLRKAWPISTEVVLIGSREGDVLLERDETIAPRHGRLRLEGDQWMVEDLRTLNGIYRRLQKPELISVGDYVRAGRQTFRLASYQELFGAHPPPVPSAQVKFVGSPAQAADLFYVAQVLDNRKVGHLFSLDEHAPRVVGRQTGDLVFAADEFLSGRHFQLQARDGRCEVKDLESRNGVYVRISEPTPIAAGQLLLFGETLVRFELG